MVIGEIIKDVKYYNIEIDIKGIETKKDLLYKVSKELNFPVIGENNYDAFNDWLGCLYEPYDKYKAIKITFKNCKNLNSDIRKTFLELLQYSANTGFVTDNSEHEYVPCYYEILD